MTSRLLALGVLAPLAVLGACSHEDGTGPGVGGGGEVEACPADAPCDDVDGPPTHGDDEGARVGGAAEEDGTSAGSGDTGGFGESTGQGGGAGEGGQDPGGTGGAGGSNACKTCCTGPLDVGSDRYVVRVDDSNAFTSPLVVDALLPTWTGATHLPVRTHEYLNVHPPRVDGAGPFAVEAGAAPVQIADGDHVVALQVAVRHVPAAANPARTIALVVDTSPSAAASGPRILAAVDAVVAQMRPADRLAVYSWSSDPRVRTVRAMAPVGDVLDPADVHDAVRRQLDERDPSAAPGAALVDAIAAARAAADGAASVVLVSDGSTGVDGDTLEAVRSAATGDDPVRVVGVGVGPAIAYSDAVIDAITDASGGAALYYDGSPAADALLRTRFGEMVDVARSGVRLRLSTPPSVSLVVTSAGDASDAGDPEVEVLGQNLAAGGTMTFHEVLRWTGDPETAPCDAIRWTVVDGDDTVLATGAIALADALAGAALRPATAEGLAVVAAATALEGPTERRLQRAVEAIHAAHALRGGAWEASPLASLCATVTTACARLDLACGACPGEDH